MTKVVSQKATPVPNYEGVTILKRQILQKIFTSELCSQTVKKISMPCIQLEPEKVQYIFDLRVFHF